MRDKNVLFDDNIFSFVVDDIVAEDRDLGVLRIGSSSNCLLNVLLRESCEGTMQ